MEDRDRHDAARASRRRRAPLAIQPISRLNTTLVLKHSCILEFLVEGVVTTGALVGRSNHRCCCTCELLLIRSLHCVPLH